METKHINHHHPLLELERTAKQDEGCIAGCLLRRVKRVSTDHIQAQKHSATSPLKRGISHTEQIKNTNKSCTKPAKPENGSKGRSKQKEKQGTNKSVQLHRETTQSELQLSPSSRRWPPTSKAIQYPVTLSSDTSTILVVKDADSIYTNTVLNCPGSCSILYTQMIRSS
ncbi:hypothetical protein Ancab_039658 [Ancistrocladus abbreviatus]